MYNLLKKKSSGFSLVELIVVIAIIGILSAIVMASFSQARAKSRDAQRKTDIKQYELALKLYEEQFGGLPNCSEGVYLRNGTLQAHRTGACTDLTKLQDFLNDYSGSMPSDPRDDGNRGPYVYFYDSDHAACGSGGPILAVRQMEGDAPEDPRVLCGDESGPDDSPFGSDGDLDGAPVDSVYLIRLNR